MLYHYYAIFSLFYILVYSTILRNFFPPLCWPYMILQGPRSWAPYAATALVDFNGYLNPAM